MFNENFSFGSAPHPTFKVEECTSAEISPLTSRSNSPRPSKPATRRDSRFDAYRRVPRHPSITALTAQLQSQALTDMEVHSPPPSEPASPVSSTFDQDDEGFYDGSDTPATSLSEFSYDSSDMDPAVWDWSMSDSMVATSSPRPSLSLEAQALSSYTMRRRQRQALVRLQCLVSRTPDLAMLIEECHPSSLPLETDTVRAYNAKSRSDSVCSIGGTTMLSTMSGRVEKGRSGSATAAVRKEPRMRKRGTR